MTYGTAGLNSGSLHCPHLPPWWKALPETLEPATEDAAFSPIGIMPVFQPVIPSLPVVIFVAPLWERIRSMTSAAAAAPLLLLLRIDRANVCKTHFHDAMLQGMQGHIVVFHDGSYACGFKAPYHAGHLLPQRIEFGNDITVIVCIHGCCPVSIPEIENRHLGCPGWRFPV